MQNTLYWDNNLTTLREYIPSAGFYTSQIWEWFKSAGLTFTDAIV